MIDSIAQKPSHFFSDQKNRINVLLRYILTSNRVLEPDLRFCVLPITVGHF